ncbi:hypothetical protein BDW75DRAFT_226626 [Aspergillus navahoensis]
MPWSVEGIIAFITLIVTIPTCIIAVYTIIKRWRGYRPYYSPKTPSTPRTRRQINSFPGGVAPPLVPGSAPPRWLTSTPPHHRNHDPQSFAKEGSSHFYYVLHFGAFEVRQPIPGPRRWRP